MRTGTPWASIVLVLIMQVTLAWSIESAAWVPGLGIMAPIVVLAVLTAAVLASLRWMPVSVAHGWSFVAGFFATFYAAAHTLDRYASVDVAWLDATGTYGRMQLVRDWYVGWIRVAAENAYDRSLLHQDMSQLFAVVTLGLLLWLLSYICAWFAIRYASWTGAALPSGFALLFNLYSARREDGLIYMVVFMLCAFLLAARTHLALRVEHWRALRLGHSPDLEFEFLRDALVATLLVIGLAFILPGSVRSDLLRATGRQLEGFRSSAQNFSLRYLPNLDYAYEERGGGSKFGTAMPLTGAIRLGNNPVFDAHLAAAGDESLLPKYFRMAVYDRYDGAGWQRTVGDRVSSAGGDHDLAPDVELTVPISQTIETLRDATEQLYAAPQPESFSVPIRIETAPGSDEALTVESTTALPVGARYDVVSRLSVADEASLRSARTDDPDWVVQRYTGLPEGVTERVQALSAKIASGAPTRYDAARGIEGFLRREMTYDENIGPPPVDRDKVDWFLFETKRGYCDYYASSFVVLARSAGIPARLAAGYVRGAAEPSGAYRQRDSDAHTWPEVYFPAYGWVEFEPTASESPIARPATLDDLSGAVGDALPQQAQPERADRLPEDDLLPEERRPMDRDPAALASLDPSPWRMLAPILYALVGGLAGAAILRFAWLRPLGGLSAAAGAYTRVVRAARWFGLGQRRTETPAEYSHRVGVELPAAAVDLDAITHAYVGEVFGRRQSEHDAGTLDSAWRHVRRALVAAAGRLGIERARRMARAARDRH